MRKNALELRNVSKFGKTWAINFQTKAQTISKDDFFPRRFGDRRQGDWSHIMEMYAQGQDNLHMCTYIYSSFTYFILNIFCCFSNVSNPLELI